MTSSESETSVVACVVGGGAEADVDVSRLFSSPSSVLRGSGDGSAIVVAIGWTRSRALRSHPMQVLTCTLATTDRVMEQRSEMTMRT